MNYYSLSDIKKKNYSAVFHYIYQNPGCPKQQIAKDLNISLPTVSQHLGTLLEEKLIRQGGRLKSSVGRKAMSYEIIPDCRIAVGLELISECAYVVAIDLYGHKIAKEKISVPFGLEDSYFETISRYVKEFISRNTITPEQLLGIGIAVQGLVSPDGQTITYGKILNNTGLSVEKFQRHFDVPCHFSHDAMCAAASELWENPQLTDAVYISLSRHLGGAVILDRKVLTGTSGKSGTFEHMTLVPGGRPCYCGKLGCAEAYCSAKDLIPRNIEAEDFFRQKAEGNETFRARWTEYLDYLSLLIHNIRSVMENEIILGGHITPYLTEDDIFYIRQNISQLSTFPSESDISAGKCRSDAAPIGAALTYINTFLETLLLEEQE